VTPQRFARQVGLLAALGCSFCSMDRVAEMLAGDAGPPRPVVLTFDDGFSDLYEYLLPVVLARRMAAIVYLVSDKQQADWTDWGPAGPPRLLTRSEAEKMAAAGIAIGSHTRTHARLTECPPGRLHDEVAGSKKALEDRLGRRVDHFCYPYGAYDERVVRAVESAGYRTACTVERGVVPPGGDPLRLPRIPVGRRTHTFGFLKRLLLGR